MLRFIFPVFRLRFRQNASHFPGSRVCREGREFRILPAGSRIAPLNRRAPAAESWVLVTHLPLNRRAPALALAMHTAPREICLTLGVGGIMGAIRKNLAPDTADAAHRDIILFLVLRRPNLTLGEYLAQFQLTRRRAEARLPNGGTFPDVCPVAEHCPMVFPIHPHCRFRAESKINGHCEHLW